MHQLHREWHHRSFPFWAAAVLAAVGCVLAQPSSAAPDTHAVDYVHLADLIVNRSWKLERGERVVIF